MLEAGLAGLPGQADTERQLCCDLEEWALSGAATWGSQVEAEHWGTDISCLPEQWQPVLSPPCEVPYYWPLLESSAGL